MSKADSIAGGMESKEIDSRIHVDRFCRLGFRFGSIDVIILDDLRATICPILKTTIEMDQLTIHLNPRLFHVSLLGFKTRVDYLSPKIGDWEPFVEKFNISLSYRTLYKVPGRENHHPHKRSQNHHGSPSHGESIASHVEGHLPPLPRKYRQNRYSNSSLPKYTHFPGHYHVSPMNVLGTSSSSTDSPGGARSFGIAPTSETPRSAPNWAQFIPDTTISVFSLSPLSVNVTPQLCHLLMWFVPTFIGYVTASSLVTRDVSTGPLPQDLCQLSTATRRSAEISASLDALDVGTESILEPENNVVCRTLFSHHIILFFGLSF